MNDLTKKAHGAANRSRNSVAQSPAEQGSDSAWSERMALLVVAWIVVIVLLPLHALMVFSLLSAGTDIVGLLFIGLFAVPLALVDIWAYRWFSDNFGFFRWANRGGHSATGRGQHR